MSAIIRSCHFEVLENRRLATDFTFRANCWWDSMPTHFSVFRSWWFLGASDNCDKPLSQWLFGEKRRKCFLLSGFLLQWGYSGNCCSMGGQGKLNIRRHTHTRSEISGAASDRECSRRKRKWRSKVGAVGVKLLRCKLLFVACDEIIARDFACESAVDVFFVGEGQCLYTIKGKFSLLLFSLRNPSHIPFPLSGRRAQAASSYRIREGSLKDN